MLRTPLAMKRLKLRLLSDDAQAAARALAQLSVIHLQELGESEKELDEFPAAEFHRVFHRIKSRYKKIVAFKPHQSSLDRTEPSPAISNQSVTLAQLKSADEKLKKLWIEVSTLEEKQRQLKEHGGAVKQLQASLQRFLSLEIDLSRLGRESIFLNVLTGTIASVNRPRLTRALSIIGYVLNRFHSKGGLDYVIIVGSSQQSTEVGELLKSADFRALSLPAEFKDRPEMIRQQLSKQRADIDQCLQDANRQLENLISDHEILLSEVLALLHQAMPYASLAAYLKGRGRLVSLQGWVPESRQQEIHGILSDRLKYPFYLDFETPSTKEFEQVPTELIKSRLVSPFQSLVGQYGLPQYGEFDPGFLFALSYTLMFGMMFGDVGHGAVIVILALMLRHRSTAIAAIGSLAGLSSICFGFVYGSLFGYEHILHPLWMSPMHDPQLVLLLALYWGIGFLIIANLLAIRNLLVRDQIHQALYGPQGVTGLLFYVVAVLSVMLLFGPDSKMPGWAVPILLILMSIMLYYQWQQSSGSPFERVLVVLIEGLEFIISNVSATLSFLRVAAFTLNHIALAAAVFAIAAMLDHVGHWVAIVLGNIFIIVLEGAIVAIQCLRLEYYEGFSRFFSGKGRRYRPLKTELL